MLFCREFGNSETGTIYVDDKYKSRNRLGIVRWNSNMEKNIGTYMMILVVNASRNVFATCAQRLLRPIYGQECDVGEAEVLHKLKYWQCIYQCLHRGSMCDSMSYNAVDEVCAITESPCHELSPHADFQTNVLHDLTHHRSHCLQWSPCNGNSPARSIAYDQADGTIWLARWEDLQGNLLIGYIIKSNTRHVAYFEHIIETEVRAPFTGCDLITIADDCSAAWAEFIIGEPVPHNAVETGYIIGHGPVYVGRYIRPDTANYRFGFYVAGKPLFTHPLAHVFDINTFDMMVIV